MLAAVHQGLVSDPGAPCWARSAVGLAVALICWLGFLGVRTSYRYHQDGRVGTARATGAAVAVGVLAALALVWVGFTHLFPA
ncbi:hypothetical protein GCM10023201_12040 [Actinomycetospora corticicola]|jgi:hypothetical protein|uniref:Uncharacterized protein n=1 Tax=Actinomycetospora corticicola TaxID=663602 RepID=A0A7Y9J804_9PSEU|nr:hypothetical protein [Actinomycetospora corticicola]NYD38783.1 hypothetical protein [Actinomycetospora corticicola]